MHVYIYDDFVNGKRYDAIRDKIETRITDLGLSGKIIRLGIMKDTFGAVRQEIKRGVKTIIAVGDNKIVNQTLNSILYSEKNNANLNIPLGIIPVGEKNNDIAHALGINSIDEACDIIAARRIKKLDVGLITSKKSENDKKEKYFLSQIKIPSKKTVIEIDKNFSIENQKKGFFYITNLPTEENILNKQSNPQDGVLELLTITAKEKKLLKNQSFNTESLFPFKNITVNSDYKELIINEDFKTTIPFDVSIVKNKINIIVGKDRNF